LVGLFFEQDKSKARKGLEIYKRSVIQHEDLQRLYATCQKMQIVNQAPALEAPPESFLGTMQEYADTAKAGEMPAGVGARRSNRTSGGSAPPSESSPGAAAAAITSPSGGTASPQQNANVTLDALFGEMNIQTPPQNAREAPSGVVAGRNFLPAGTTASAPNDDPFGLATITHTNGTGGNSNRGHQPAASTSANLPPAPVRAPNQQQQQHVRNGSNNPFGDDLFGAPKKAVAAPVDLNSLYEQANTRQQQQHQQPQQQQYGGGMMPPPMGGGMPQQMMMGNHPGYYQQQQTQHHHHSLQQQQQQTSPPQYGGMGGGYPPQAAAAQNMGYPTMMAAGGQYHSPPGQNFHPQQQQHFNPPLQQQQQQHSSNNNNNNNNNNFLI
jgi:hypothetical protein